MNEILFLVIFVLLLGTVLIAHFKRKDLIETQRNSVSQNLNTNPALVKHFQILIIVVCSLISYLPWIFQVYKIESKVIWYVLTNIQTQIVTGLISPYLFYVFNAKLRKYCVDQFWNFSPDWFYKLRPFDLNSQIDNAAKYDMNETSINVIIAFFWGIKSDRLIQFEAFLRFYFSNILQFLIHFFKKTILLT